MTSEFSSTVFFAILEGNIEKLKTFSGFLNVEIAEMRLINSYAAYAAALSGSLDIVKFLFDEHVDFHAVDNTG